MPVRLEATSGEKLANPIPVDGSQPYGVATLAGGGYVVTWSTYLGPGHEVEVYWRLFASDGTPLTPANLVVPPSGYTLSVRVAALANGDFAMAWYSSTGLQLQIFTPAGTPRFPASSQGNSSASFALQGLVGGGLALSYGNDTKLFDASGTLVGTLLGVPAGTAISGFPDGRVVAVGAVTQTGTGSDIVGLVYTQTGFNLGLRFNIDTSYGEQTAPDVAVLANGAFAATWVSQLSATSFVILARVFDPTGLAIGPVITVSAVGTTQNGDPSIVAIAGGGFVVSWTASGEEDGSGAGVFARAFAADGAADGGAMRVTELTAGDQTSSELLRLADGSLLAAWRGAGEGDDDGIFTRRIALDDAPDAPPDPTDDVITVTTTGPVTIEVLANDFDPDDVMTVSAVGAPGAGSAVINADGTITYTPGAAYGGSDSFTYTVSTDGGATTRTASVAVLDGRTPTRVSTQDELVNLDPSYIQNTASIAALTTGGYVVAYVEAAGGANHVWARVYDAAGVAQGSPLFVDNTTAAAGPANVTALESGQFVVLYEFNSGGGALIARRFSGTAQLGSDITLTTGGTIEGFHAAKRAGAGFAATFTVSGDVFVKIYDGAGTQVGSTLVVSSNGLNENNPAIAQLANGNYAVTWARTIGAGDRDVFVRLMGPAGAVAAEFRAHAPSAGDQAAPVVAVLSGGDFVVAWQDDGDIRFQRYTQAGAAIGASILANVTTAGVQAKPAISALADGSFVLTWTSAGQDGDGAGVFARLFGANGAAIGAEFRVAVSDDLDQGFNTYEINHVTQLTGGDLVFAWSGFGGDNDTGTVLDATGVFTTRHALNAPPPAGTGTSSDDTFTGDGTANSYNLRQGGRDIVSGGGGNDGFDFGATFTPVDRVDGGPGTNDQLALQGAYAGADALTFSANNFTGIEVIALLPGGDYDLTTVQANVAPGGSLAFFAGALAATDTFTFHGQAETDGGAFTVYGGLGVDRITTGSGNDGIYFGAGRFGSRDFVDGGPGANDQLALDGIYTAVLSHANVQNVEVLVLLAGSPSNRYVISLAADLLTSGQPFTVYGQPVSQSITLNAAPSAGAISFFGGSNQDLVTLGAGGSPFVWGAGGADYLFAGAGADVFFYQSAGESSATGRVFDRIGNFGASGADRIDLPVAVTGIDPTINTGLVRDTAADFAGDMQVALASLQPNHAVLFHPDAGTGFVGATFLAVDANGIAGFQAGQDYLMQLLSPPSTISLSYFI